MRNKSF